jgi:hypothetical protein
MKKTNKYLYGDNTPPKIPEAIIRERVRLLNLELENQLKEHPMKRDSERCNAIIKAIKFWTHINYK